MDSTGTKAGDVPIYIASDTMSVRRPGDLQLIVLI
jgi:hypothetical protein